MSDESSRFRDPAARNYLFVALAALLIVAAAMFVRGGLPAALLPVGFAALGLLTRRTTMPGAFLILLCYFIVLPFGLPFFFPSGGSDIPGSHFRIMDVILAGAVVVYFACQYRLLSLTHQGMPFDTPQAQRPNSAQPPRRPLSLVADDEIGRMLLVAGLCVFLGQLVWLLVAEFRPSYHGFPPFVTVGLSHSDPGDRFLLLAGIMAGAGLVAGLVFWYWRLARLSQAEARLVLLDVQWTESRRELNRQEKWRAWGRSRGRPRERRPRKRRSFVEAAAVTFLILLGALFVAWLAIVGILWLRHH